VEPGTKDAIEIPLMELRDTLESHRWGMTLEDTIECGLTIPSRYDIVQVFGENVAIHGKSKMHALASKWETFQEKTDVKIVLGPLVIFADPGIREQYKEESWALSPELFKADPDSVYYWEHNDLEGPTSQDMETSMWFLISQTKRVNGFLATSKWYFSICRSNTCNIERQRKDKTFTNCTICLMICLSVSHLDLKYRSRI